MSAQVVEKTKSRGLCDPLLQGAWLLWSAGLAVIPAHESKTKRPFRRWKSYQSERPLWEQVESWLMSGAYDAIGVITGAASGNVELLELEGPGDVATRYFGRLHVEAHKRGPQAVALLQRVTGGFACVSAGGGAHFYVRVTDGPAKQNLKFAMAGQGDGRRVIAESRGEGGFVIAPPSPGRMGHPAGAYYRQVAGHHPSRIAEVTKAERDQLHDLFRTLDEPEKEWQPEPAPLSPSQSTVSATHYEGTSTFDDFRSRVSWKELLEPAGWVWSHRVGDDDMWVRPGKPKTEGHSAVTHGEGGPLVNFSTSVSGWPVQVGLSKAQVYAHLHHGGDASAAAKALMVAGYGSRPQRVALGEFTPLGSTGADGEQRGFTTSDGRVHLFRDGGSFILDTAEAPRALWGEATEVLWARGESCLVTGPIGGGKTTLMGNLTRASLGLAPYVLGFPVEPCERVLYLACDRPQQIARNLSRMFSEDDRAVLSKRLIVWQGPPPGDIAKDPTMLIALCQQAGLTEGDRVIIDGTKDLAVGLASDEVGAAVNIAFQQVLAAGIDLLANHHQRKSGENGGKPRTLTDVYGSMHIPAGCGTVLLVWAEEPGSTVTEFSTLKPAADHVGPITVVHHLDTGSLSAEGNVTVEDVLRSRRHTTSTVVELCRAMGHDLSGKDEQRKRSLRERVRRQVERHVERGAVTRWDSPSDRGGKAEAHYQWTGP